MPGSFLAALAAGAVPGDGAMHPVTAAAVAAAGGLLLLAHFKPKPPDRP